MSKKSHYPNRSTQNYMSKADHKNEPVFSNTPKVVKRNYHVTSQTAYHIQKLALQYGMTEGRVIDKIIRGYLADKESCRSLTKL